MQVDAGTHARRADTLSLSIAIAHVALAYTPVYLAAAVGPSWLLVPCWLAVGWLHNGLINLMHECAHYLMFRRRWANDLLGGWVLAPLVLTDFAEYRRRHWDHHRHLGGPQDPKLVYRTDIRGSGIAALALRCAVGIEALRRITEKPEIEAPAAGAGRKALAPRLFLAHGLLLASLYYVAYVSHGSPRRALWATALAYGVWGYGLGAVTIFAAALRAIAEHQVYEDAAPHEGEAALRNLKCNPLTRLVFGAYGFGEHATHHREPAVPYYALPALTDRLAADEPTLVARQGYLATILDCARGRAGAHPATLPPS
jgi:fatty acid desaturase